ncbi:MAG: hypothetical protein IT516_11740 [Burkholderiales bacterium]|nr:hypothetical protein [Burkholderiales bacterium]
MLVLLLALVIVAWLAKDALVKYGMLSTSTTTTKRAGPAGAAPSATEPAVTPANAIEKAKALEGFLQQESTKRDGGN